MGGGRRGGDGDADGVGERGGGARGAEEGVYGGGGVEVGDGFGFEKGPDGGVVDFAEAVVSPADGCYCPWEGWEIVSFGFLGGLQSGGDGDWEVKLERFHARFSQSRIGAFAACSLEQMGSKETWSLHLPIRESLTGILIRLQL